MILNGGGAKNTISGENNFIYQTGKVVDNMYILKHRLLETKVKVKVGVLRPVQQPGSYWDRSSVLAHTEVTVCGLKPYLFTTRPSRTSSFINTIKGTLI